jgi:large subunit ribosomal protein L5
MRHRLEKTYLDEVRPALLKECSYKSVYDVPKLQKIVVNRRITGTSSGPIGAAPSRATSGSGFQTLIDELNLLTSQKPIETLAKKSIASFKIREDMPVGLTVTLRGEKMYSLFDRLIHLAFPRQRDFRGLSFSSFDGRGNYTIGLRDQLLFPEIDYDKVSRFQGMGISIVTTATTDDEGFALLKKFGFPCRERGVAALDA